MGTGSVQRETYSQSQSVFIQSGFVFVYGLLPFTGSLMHQWRKLNIPFFSLLVGLDVYILYCSSHLRVYCVFAPIRVNEVNCLSCRRRNLCLCRWCYFNGLWINVNYCLSNRKGFRDFEVLTGSAFACVSTCAHANISFNVWPSSECSFCCHTE